ncbi:MAG: PDZ domain-containing protein [Syntrophomonadaceae bacterium]|nr:PDZ domain-containing protein [Syntrophomonadaceae bacterium]
MDWYLSVLYMMGQVIIDSFTSPIFIILYLLLMVLSGWQYKKLEKISAAIINTKGQTFIKSTVISAFLGLIGGLLGSILLVFIGIDLQSIGILPLWIIALALMLISPRYLCFAYAGGILAFINLVFGYPQVSIPQLMALIAILHMVESLLILLSGHLNPMPVYVKYEDQIRGGFNLQKFWPIPLIVLVSAGISDPTSGVMMPEWWPLLKDYDGFVEGVTYTLLPVLAILGYGEISTTCSPKEKARKSALHLFIFSMCLLVLSVIASYWNLFLPIVALFSPLGHEIVIWLGMRHEKNKKPEYVAPSKGVGVLAIEKPSFAARTGIKPGDIILSVNGKEVDSKNELIEQVNQSFFLVLEIKRRGEILKISGKKYYDDELGIIFVPDNRVKRYLTVKEDSLLDILANVRGKV